jgi:hypothetical protein
MNPENVIIVIIFVISLVVVGALRFKLLQGYWNEMEKIYEKHPEWLGEDFFN